MLLPNVSLEEFAVRFDPRFKLLAVRILPQNAVELMTVLMVELPRFIIDVLSAVELAVVLPILNAPAFNTTLEPNA